MRSLASGCERSVRPPCVARMRHVWPLVVGFTVFLAPRLPAERVLSGPLGSFGAFWSRFCWETHHTKLAADQIAMPLSLRPPRKN